MGRELTCPYLNLMVASREFQTVYSNEAIVAAMQHAVEAPSRAALLPEECVKARVGVGVRGKDRVGVVCNVLVREERRND